MIIDVHCHNFANSVAMRAMNGMCKVTEGTLWAVGDGTLDNHLDYLDLAGVDKAVLCPIATKPNQFDIILRRSKSIMDGEFGERAKQKIIPFASVHPMDEHWPEHLKEIADAGIKGVKLHPYYQCFRLDDPAVWPMFHRIAELGLVVQCHAGADLAYLDSWDVCGPRHVVSLLKNVRGLKFIAAHLGGCEGYPPHATDELLECGAWIDTSAIHKDWFKDEQMRLLRSWPRERILFGTDFPWTHYPEAIAWVKSVRDQEDWDDLFGNNACRLLGI